MVSEKHRRLLLERRRTRERPAIEMPVHAAQRKGLDRFYHDHYKQLFLITIALFLGSLLVIGMTYVRTGDIIYKGVSLSGGLTITVPATDVDINALADGLRAEFPDADFAIREISDLGTQIAVVIEAAPRDASAMQAFEGQLTAYLGARMDMRDASTEVVGSTLGASFFQQVAKAVLIAFTFMGLVVFIYFGETKAQKAMVLLLSILEAILIWYAGNLIVGVLALLVGIALVVLYVRFSIPSAAVILAAISTLLFTVAVVDLLELRISTAGIAAFLMLIGYSVDTDILLSTRVLKRTEGSVYDRVKSTIGTGLTMQGTTMTAAGVALIFTQSDVIREIMLIIFIGLIADIFYTWIQNAGILRVYLEGRGRT